MHGHASNVLKKQITFQSGRLLLEGILHTVDRPGLHPAVVVCHPDPLRGGSMHNAVVVSVCEELADRGISALHFNFRGVELSQGAYGGGEDEIEDVRAAVSYVISLPSSEVCCIGVAGYSFGSYVGLRAAAGDERVRAVAGISPALVVHDYGFLREYRLPKLLLAGEHDEFLTRDEFLKLGEDLPEPRQIELVRFADHFWQGFERRVATKVATFFKQVFDEVLA
ncbi:MAG: dienelactone hydrolase family protein [Chloroflexi bacterium]|nr:dienelactone hydrolase family protein [Chloroflexota bacterium]